MLKIPRILVLQALLAAVLVILGIVFIIRPLAGHAWKSFSSIIEYVHARSTTDLKELEARYRSLRQADAQIERVSSASHTSAGWFDCLRTALDSNGIEAARIQGSGIKRDGQFNYEDFHLSCRTDYHKLGAFISDCENGSHVCAIKSLHVISKSLLDNMLDVDIGISFYRPM